MPSEQTIYIEHCCGHCSDLLAVVLAVPEPLPVPCIVKGSCRCPYCGWAADVRRTFVAGYAPGIQPLKGKPG